MLKNKFLNTEDGYINIDYIRQLKVASEFNSITGEDDWVILVVYNRDNNTIKSSKLAHQTSPYSSQMDAQRALTRFINDFDQK